MNRLLVVLSMMLGIATVSLAGSADGGGGDFFPDEASNNQVWFQGQDKISFCFDGDLGLGKEAEALIEKKFQLAMNKWEEYLSKSGVNFESFEHKAVADAERVLLPSTYAPKCTGTEEIRIVLGASQDKAIQDSIVAQKAKHNDPVALVHILKRKPGRGKRGARAQGYIWLAPQGSIDVARKFPDWKNETEVEAILLHEVGHLVGIPHVEGTIMRESLMMELLFQFHMPPGMESYPNNIGIDQVFKSIDHTREVVFNPKMRKSFLGNPFLRAPQKAEAMRKALSELVGVELKRNPVMVRFVVDGDKGYLMIHETTADIGKANHMVEINFTLGTVPFNSREVLVRESGLIRKYTGGEVKRGIVIKDGKPDPRNYIVEFERNTQPGAKSAGFEFQDSTHLVLLKADGVKTLFTSMMSSFPEVK